MPRPQAPALCTRKDLVLAARLFGKHIGLGKFGHVRGHGNLGVLLQLVVVHKHAVERAVPVAERRLVQGPQHRHGPVEGPVLVGGRGLGGDKVPRGRVKAERADGRRAKARVEELQTRALRAALEEQLDKLRAVVLQRPNQMARQKVLVLYPGLAVEQAPQQVLHHVHPRPHLPPRSHTVSPR